MTVRILPPTSQDDPEDDIPLSELREDPDDEILLSELRDLMRQLPSPEEMLSAEDFANIDGDESTGQQLSDDDILTLVSREVAENADDDSGESSDPARKDVSSKEAPHCISKLISYFDESMSSCSSDDTKTNTDALDFLWKLSSVVNERTLQESKQTKLTDFFN